MAEELMTAKDAADCQMYAEDGMNPPWSRERARRMYATYAECTRLRAALTEREGECERGKALRDAVVRYRQNAGMAVVKLTLLRGTKGTKASDKAKYTAAIGALETVVKDLGKMLDDAARGPRTGGDSAE